MNNEKRQYKVLNPIAWGGRVERGEVILLTPDEAANFGSNVIALEAVPLDEQKPEPAIDDMKLPELRAKAKEMGLSTTGSKADLLERIKLALNN